jgi:hypothetical protein
MYTVHSLFNAKSYAAWFVEFISNSWQLSCLEVSSIDTLKDNPSRCASWRHTAGAAAQLHSFLPSVTDGQKSISRCVHFTPGKEPLLPVGQEVVWAPQPIWTSLRREKIFFAYRDSNSWLSKYVVSKRRPPLTRRHTATSNNTGILW